MNEKLAAHIAVLKLNTRLLVNCLDGVTEEHARKQLEPELNNMSFLVAHLIDARHYLAKMLGSNFPNPVAALTHAKKVGDVEELPSLEELRRGWNDVTEQLTDRLAIVTDGDLREESQQPFPIEDGTVLGGIAFLLQHESYHVGQLGLLRRLLGYPPMSYGDGT